jgi:hypothetical protein
LGWEVGWDRARLLGPVGNSLSTYLTSVRDSERPRISNFQLKSPGLHDDSPTEKVEMQLLCQYPGGSVDFSLWICNLNGSRVLGRSVLDSESERQGDQAPRAV